MGGSPLHIGLTVNHDLDHRSSIKVSVLGWSKLYWYIFCKLKWLQKHNDTEKRIFPITQRTKSESILDTRTSLLDSIHASHKGTSEGPGWLTI